MPAIVASRRCRAGACSARRLVGGILGGQQGGRARLRARAPSIACAGGVKPSPRYAGRTAASASVPPGQRPAGRRRRSPTLSKRASLHGAQCCIIARGLLRGGRLGNVPRQTLNSDRRRVSWPACARCEALRAAVSAAERLRWRQPSPEIKQLPAHALRRAATAICWRNPRYARAARFFLEDLYGPDRLHAARRAVRARGASAGAAFPSTSWWARCCSWRNCTRCRSGWTPPCRVQRRGKPDRRAADTAHAWRAGGGTGCGAGAPDRSDAGRRRMALDRYTRSALLLRTQPAADARALRRLPGLGALQSFPGRVASTPSRAMNGGAGDFLDADRTARACVGCSMCSPVATCRREVARHCRAARQGNPRRCRCSARGRRCGLLLLLKSVLYRAAILDRPLPTRRAGASRCPRLPQPAGPVGSGVPQTRQA